MGNNISNNFIKFAENLRMLHSLSSLDIMIDILIESIKETWSFRYDESYLDIIFDKKKETLTFFINVLVIDNNKEIDNICEITFDKACQAHPTCKVGDRVLMPLENSELFTRTMINQIQRNITTRINTYHKNEEYNLFKEKIGTIMQGTIKKIIDRNIIVSLGKHNGILYKTEQVFKEQLQRGQKLYFYITDVQSNYTPKGYQIFLSRKDIKLVINLLEKILPEINDKIFIKGIARISGEKTMIALESLDDNINPVSMAIGYKGSIINELKRELLWERVDFILWDNNLREFITNCLKDIDIIDIVIDRLNSTIVIKVPRDQVNIAIGNKGINSRLISHILPERFEKISIINSDENIDTKNTLINELNIDKEIYDLLRDRGHPNVNSIYNISLGEFLKLFEDIDANLMEELHNRTLIYVKKEKEKYKELGGEDELFMYYNLEPTHCIFLVEKNIKNLNDLRQYNSEELQDLLASIMNKSDIIDLSLNM